MILCMIVQLYVMCDLVPKVWIPMDTKKKLMMVQWGMIRAAKWDNGFGIPVGISLLTWTPAFYKKRWSNVSDASG